MSVPKKLALIALGCVVALVAGFGAVTVNELLAARWAAEPHQKYLQTNHPREAYRCRRVVRGLSLMDVAERFFVAAAAASLLLIVATAWLVELS